MFTVQKEGESKGGNCDAQRHATNPGRSSEQFRGARAAIKAPSFALTLVWLPSSSWVPANPRPPMAVTVNSGSSAANYPPFLLLTAPHLLMRARKSYLFRSPSWSLHVKRTRLTNEMFSRRMEGDPFLHTRLRTVSPTFSLTKPSIPTCLHSRVDHYSAFP